MTATFLVTPRDLEVLNLIRPGYSNKEIGTALGISPRTVKQHIRLMSLRAGIPGNMGVRLKLLNLVDGLVLNEEKLSTLRPREQAIIRLACQGLTNKEIAEQVSESEKWGEQIIKNEMKKIFDRVGAYSRAELRHMFIMEPKAA